MKKTYLFALLCATMTLGFVSCGKPEEPVNIPDSFPRKQLIEHFTSQSCGYCPDGISAIEEVVSNSDNYVWVSHHAGYADDIFTISGSKTLARNFGVNSAPSMMLNREKVSTNGRKMQVFHPGYINVALHAKATSSTAIASVKISNEYDANSGLLKVKVNGQCADATLQTLYLTVLVKESGMNAAQSDYVHTFEGWQEFVHTNAVRAFLSEPLGDEVVLTKQQYEQSYELTLDEKWKAENCMVVAYIFAEEKEPIINAEQEPVVSGTKGGLDIDGGGKVKVAVPETYPEEGTPVSEVTYSSGIWANSQDIEAGGHIFAIQLAAPQVNIENGSYFPLCVIYLAATTDTIPYGTYEFVQPDTFNYGKALAGYKYDTEQATGISGSQFYYINLPYYTQYRQLYPDKQWLMTTGTVEVSAAGVTYDVTTLTGAKIKGTFEGTLIESN